MKKILLFTLITVAMVACQQDKQTQLQEAKKELKEIKAKIASLEAEIATSDTTNNEAASNAALVSAVSIEPGEFVHAIEVRGSVESKKNVLISAETGGVIRKVHVEEGQEVSTGQILISLDADIIRNNVVTLKTQLELAAAVYERQKRLWEQNIGTEIQYLEAKNKKETLESQLATANSQLDQAVVRAPFSGVIDQIPAREGELTQPGMPLVRLLNPNQMYIRADVSERYIGRFKAGDKVEIYFPAQEQTVQSQITSVSSVINQENRTFSVEVSMPSVKFPVKPNQVTVLNMHDYSNEDAIAVPTNIIRKDASGNYVFVLSKDNKGNVIAQKRSVVTGVSFNSKTEILKGLETGDKVIDKGINELTDGAHVQLSDSDSSSQMASEEN